ncbi:MAG: hypothetical protein ING36_01530 [Burkholderiales bacterium]|jgi:carbamoyltransferase|nr:hypothetical protein [Burkholderiales bacterium]
MAVLAIQLGHNATVGVSDIGKIVGLLSQEKVDNVKNSSAFPIAAAESILKECNVSAASIDTVVICGNYIRPNFLQDSAESFREHRPGLMRMLLRPIKGWIVKTALAPIYYSIRYKHLMRSRNHVDDEISQRLKKIGIYAKQIKHIDHHTCHAYSGAFYFRDNVPKRLIFTLDGEGDDRCGSIWVKSGSKMELLSQIPIDCSIGHLYTGVTKFLGMTPLEHEYKVMGLSAYCKQKYVKPAYERLFKNKVRVVGAAGHYSIKIDFDATQSEDYLKKNSYGIRFDNLAGAVQLITEEIVLEWIEKNVELTGIRDVAVSGGVFMNVKLNKRIQESSKIHSVKFLPSCGDESNVIGALYHEGEAIGEPLQPLEEMYLGVSFDDEDIASFLSQSSFPCEITATKESDINSTVARLLADKQVVARASGRNEWGARSLGNRAILAHPSHMESFYTINDLIKARDFWMPFAPSIIDSDADRYLKNYDENKSYPYAMITAYDASELGVAELRAGIHQGDHTCRAQIVSKERNFEYYDLILKFKELSGVGGVLNTSLNIHGYPLAANLEQIFFTFFNSGLAYLAVGSFLVRKR